jgi:hypothetical protein
MDGGGIIRLTLNGDVADYQEHVAATNVADFDQDGMCDLGQPNSQMLVECKNDIAITPLQGSVATIQLEEVVHFRVGNLEKTFLHHIQEPAVQPVLIQFDDTL